MKISVVSTLYYSQSYIREFYARCVKSIQTIGLDYEFIFVNDGSPDDSINTVLEVQKNDPKVTLIDLSRNFGHHKAIMTGLSFAKGDYVFLIDVDLEEDPELLELYWAEMQKEANLDVVYGIQEKRKGSWFERWSGNMFYKFFNTLTNIEYPSDTFTARLMKQKYVESVVSYREKALEIWGVFVLAGFNQKGIKAHKKSKGSSTYNFKRKLKMAVETVTSFSSRPLYLIFILGLLITGLSTVFILIAVYKKLVLDMDIEGWTSLIVSIWFMGGLIMFTLGIIGIYLSKLFTEVKNRPLTIVKDIYKRDA